MSHLNNALDQLPKETRKTSIFYTLWVWFRQAFPGYEMHDRRLSNGQSECRQGHVAVQEPALVDQTEDFGAGHRLLGPIWKKR